MNNEPDLGTEHAALVQEQMKLQKLCVEEWIIMPAQVAKQRQGQLWAIRERLQVIERSAAWKRRAT